MYNERIDICKSCDKFINHKNIIYRCGVCECVLNIKARMSNQSCPLNKWGKEDVDISDKKCGGC